MTYLNKILVGFNDGHMELWNIQSKRCIYSFDSFPSPVSFMASPPVPDIVGVGLEDGNVWMMDIKQDRRLFSLHHQSSVSGLAFRTDLTGDSQMAVSLTNGTVALWDLNEKKLHTTWIAHEGPVASLLFVQNQPIIITTGGDNCISEWIVEGTETRFLRGRSGHSKTPNLIRFYGENGEAILSAGLDKSFRLVSMIKDSQSNELSQGSISKIARRIQVKAEDIKLDPIIAFDSFMTKDLKWDNVVSAHQKSHVAHTWRADHKKIGSHELKTKDNTNVTAVAMSSCGNFVFLGSESGSIDMFNVQSGMHRSHFLGHGSMTVGLAVDPANQYVVCAHKDGLLRMLEITTGRTRYSIKLDGEVLATAYHSDSELFAIAIDSTVQILDVQGHLIVRRFLGHSSKIVDVQFSQDCRWVMSASKDKTVRTWDLATNLQIDCLTLDAVPVSIAISPTMNFLAVVVEEDVAIHLWTNMSMYKPVAFEHASKSYMSLSLEEPEDGLLSSLVELSLEPRSKWTNLFNLDNIKARNKPVLPPKAIEKTPFFLDAFLGSVKRESDGTNSHPATESQTIVSHTESEFLTHLHDPESTLANIFFSLKKMGPSRADLEIRSICATPVDQIAPIIRLIDALTEEIKGHRDFELAMTFLSVTLKVYSDVICKHSVDFAESIAKTRAAVRSNWSHLQALFQEAICLVAFTREN